MARFKLGKCIATQLRESGFWPMALSKNDTIEDVLGDILERVSLNHGSNKLGEQWQDYYEWYIAPNYVTGEGKTGYSVYVRRKDQR